LFAIWLIFRQKSIGFAQKFKKLLIPLTLGVGVLHMVSEYGASLSANVCLLANMTGWLLCN